MQKIIPLKSCICTLLLVSSFLFFSCKNFNQQKAEKAIERYVQKKFLSPDSYHAKRYYPAQRIKISDEDANSANSVSDNSTVKPFDGWSIAVDMEALTTYGSKGEQSATFYFNVACDSVISSDLAPYFFMK